jgi:hypothetical protein
MKYSDSPQSYQIPNLQLPALPMYSLALITDEQKENDARDVFISYLEAELSNRN